MTRCRRRPARVPRRAPLLAVIALASAPGCSLLLGTGDLDSGGPADGSPEASSPPEDAGDAGDSDPSLDAEMDGASGEADLESEDVGPPCPEGCALGCNEAERRCFRLAPSNLDPAPIHDRATGTLDIAAAETALVDTDSGSIVGRRVHRAASEPEAVDGGIYFGVRHQADGPELAVFAMRVLSVGEGARLAVVGSRPVVFYVVGDVRLAGVVEARASGRRAGPGGGDGGLADGVAGAPCSGGEGGGGAQGGSGADQYEAGGGGGGSRGAGGAGGTASIWGGAPAPGGAGGAATGSEDLVPLRGGCGGGAGGGPDTHGTWPNNGGYGGGGGGAVQISAGGVIVVTASGGVDVAGAGGQGGLHGAGGGGGGAGGGILLEAALVSNRGMLAANGGGGGAGGYDTLTSGPDGSDGPFGLARAGGGGGAVWGGSGGAGGGVAQLSGADGAPQANGGGGGGAAGHVVLRWHDRGEVGTTSPQGPVTPGPVGLW